MLTSLSLPPFNYVVINFLTFSLFYIFLIKKINFYKNKKIPNLLNQLVSKDINVQSVSANKPSLDDVFLKVTGYRLEGEKTLIEESK